MPSKTVLSKGWQVAQVPLQKGAEAEWMECTNSPTDVHSELIKAGKIPHPYKEMNEWDTQWVSRVDWTFKTTFKVSEEQMKEPCVDLVFEGLDTYCDIEVNGKHVASTDSMFLTHRFDCKEHVRSGDNQLLLTFRSPVREAKKEEAANGGPMPLWNGSSERLYSRKAQYGWGWDWGPIIITSGPYRPVYLETYTHRFEDVRVDCDLEGPKYTTATLNASATITPTLSSSVDSYKVAYTLKTRDCEKVIEQTTLPVGKALSWTFDHGEVEPWFPRNYGSQTMYDLESALLDRSGTVLAVKHTKVAFRHAAVVEEPLEGAEGTTFLFEINGVRIFCGGSNWIPADNFFTQITPERYRAWVELLVQGNQNMLRIWGGGDYEPQALYDACDELGVLVWQDFMFGCALYPSYEKLNKSIHREAEQVVTRLRDHPSVVIFAGNNEDYAIAESLDRMDYSDNSGDYMNGQFPARHIYEIVLPQAVKSCSNIFYHRSSPYGGKTSADPTIGDIHQWSVWHGEQHHWSEWPELAGRFVSEFGMQGLPDRRTVDEWTEDKSQLYPQSKVAMNHNKATGFESRLQLYLVGSFRYSYDMPSYIYYTQIMQSECLAAAYRLWRREWRGHGKEFVAGALVWQLNDCWPCVSWAIADYHLRPKPAFYTIARELKPYTVGMARKTITEPLDASDPLDDGKIHDEISLWGCNSTLSAKKATIKLQSFNLDAGLIDTRTFKVELAPNSSTEIYKGSVPGQLVRANEATLPTPIVVHTTVIDEDGSILSRYSNWPEPYKWYDFPDPTLKISVKGEQVTLTCEKPVKGLILDIEGDGDVQWSDQAFDLFPGDPQIVTAKGLQGKDITWRHLGGQSS